MKYLFKYLITAILGFLSLVLTISTYRILSEYAPIPDENDLIKAEGLLEEIVCSEKHLKYIRVSGIDEKIELEAPTIKCNKAFKLSATGKPVSFKYYKYNDSKTNAYTFNYNGLQVFTYSDCLDIRNKVKKSLISVSLVCWAGLFFVIYKYWRKKT